MTYLNETNLPLCLNSGYPGGYRSLSLVCHVKWCVCVFISRFQFFFPSHCLVVFSRDWKMLTSSRQFSKSDTIMRLITLHSGLELETADCAHPGSFECRGDLSRTSEPLHVHRKLHNINRAVWCQIDLQQKLQCVFPLASDLMELNQTFWSAEVSLSKEAWWFQMDLVYSSIKSCKLNVVHMLFLQVQNLGAWCSVVPKPGQQCYYHCWGGTTQPKQS